MVNSILAYKKEYEERFSLNENKKLHDETIAFDMFMISKYCKSFSECKKCDFYQKENICYFKNKIPKEW